MSDKPFDQLTSTDQQLRRMFPTGMREGTDVVIRKVTGFELYNSRPYHNYETWSDGYEVETETLFAHAEDLDDALKILAVLMIKEREGQQILRYQRPRLWQPKEKSK